MVYGDGWISTSAFPASDPAAQATKSISKTLGRTWQRFDHAISNVSYLERHL